MIDRPTKLNILVSMKVKINPPYVCYDANYKRGGRQLLRCLHKGILVHC